MVDNHKIDRIMKDKTLKPELKRVLKSALNSNSVMPMKPSEMENFFDEVNSHQSKTWWHLAGVAA